MSRVIFLDVDGVLCTPRTELAKGLGFNWDPVAAAAIRIACETGAIQIVVSSVWRLQVKRPEDLYGSFRHEACTLGKRLKTFGLLPLLRKPNWRTPALNGIRGDDILFYLSANPDVDDYIILDDDQDLREDQMTRLIHTDCRDGMGHDHIRRLFKWAAPGGSPSYYGVGFFG